MPALRLAHPIWLDQSADSRAGACPALQRNIDADVAIVGGGVTGAAVAWRLASAGLSVAVLEAARVGRGSTAASTALLMQEPDEDFRRLRERYGRRSARRIWELSREATKDFVRTITRLDIDCGMAARDSIYFTLNGNEVRGLRQEHTDRIRAGVGGTWLDERALRRATGISGPAGIRTRGNAQVDPYRACLGLLRAARAEGARVYERSPVRRIDVARNGVTVTTSRGSVRATHVVVATGYATPEFKPLLARFRMLHTYVVATGRLSSTVRRELGLSDVMLWDTDRPYHYARWTDDHRLLLGGADRARVSGKARLKAFREGVRAIRSYFRDRYPVLSDVPMDYAWEGLFATTPDSLPYIGPHRRYPRHLFALGYGGNGMTFGFLAARMIDERLSGRVTSDHDLFAFARIR